MELTKIGFKQTEIGLIPEDWEAFKVGSLTEFINGIAHEKIINPLGNYVVVNSKFVSSEGNVEKNCMELINPAKKNDILMVMSDVPNGKAIAKCFLVDSDRKYSVNQRICILRSKETDPQFLFFQINRNKFYLQFDDGVKQTNLRREDVLNCPIPLPPTLTEQKAIATALSDVDALINSLDKLISKKKAIKQGTMQELLTPKDGWKTKTIKDVATYRRGSFPQPYGLSKWYDDISGMPFVQVVDVGDNQKLKPETKQRISTEGAKMSVFVKKGSVILTIQGSIGRICITQYDAYVDRTLLIFESFLEEFNKYFFMTIVHQKFEIEKEKAPGGIIKTITKESLSSFEISYPIIDEQNRIAQILSDMDLEIESLENKKAKYQEIKQGMMQELLTGKTRLVWN
jgi:type I restriction enzyme S subunit